MSHKNWKTRKSHTVLGTSGSYHFDMCVWRKMEIVIHAQSQSSQSTSLGLEEMPDEVCILGRPAELTTSIRVALMGKTVVGPAPTTWSFQRAELPDQGCEEGFMSVVDDYTNVDCGSLRRAPHSLESSERLQQRRSRS